MSINPVYHHTPQKLMLELEDIQRAKSNPVHFGSLYKKHHEQIFRYIHQRTDDIETAQDITSQVFLKAMNNLNKYEFRGLPFGSWLYRIAKSELYQSFRDNQANRTVNLDSVHLYEMMDVFNEDPSDANLRHLFVCIDKLKEEEIQLIELRFFEKRAFKEVGEILEITENNAKVKCFRILDKLKKLFLNHKPNEKNQNDLESSDFKLGRNSSQAKFYSINSRL
jgi:RNA polymerase sigma-70 factor (ECF subfamily)